MGKDGNQDVDGKVKIVQWLIMPRFVSGGGVPVVSQQIFGAANPAKRRCCKRQEVIILARFTAAGEAVLSCKRVTLER